MRKEPKRKSLPDELRRTINQVAHMKMQLRYMRYRRDLEDLALAMLAEGNSTAQVQTALLDDLHEPAR